MVSWLNYKIGYVPLIKSWKNLQRPKVVISLINKKKMPLKNVHENYHENLIIMLS